MIKTFVTICIIFILIQSISYSQNGIYSCFANNTNLAFINKDYEIFGNGHSEKGTWIWNTKGDTLKLSLTSIDGVSTLHPNSAYAIFSLDTLNVTFLYSVYGNGITRSYTLFLIGGTPTKLHTQTNISYSLFQCAVYPNPYKKSINVRIKSKSQSVIEIRMFDSLDNLITTNVFRKPIGDTTIVIPDSLIGNSMDILNEGMLQYVTRLRKIK